MNRDLERDFHLRFPGFFRDLYGDPRETGMAHGCDFADGWNRIVERLCEALEPSAPPEFKFIAVTQKFGQLRIYATNDSDETSRLIRQAPEESLSCCEQCGATEGVATEGPCRILCGSCREETRANKRPGPRGVIVGRSSAEKPVADRSASRDAPRRRGAARAIDRQSEDTRPSGMGILLVTFQRQDSAPARTPCLAIPQAPAARATLDGRVAVNRYEGGDVSAPTEPAAGLRFSCPLP
jgi:hypothetical protein